MSWGAFTLAVVAAGLPTLIFLGLVWWLDRYEKEPAHLLAVTFLWGALPAAVLAVTLDLLDAATHARRPGGGMATRPPADSGHRGDRQGRGAGQPGPLAAGRVQRRARRHHLRRAVGLGFALTENLLAFAVAFESGRSNRA